MTKLRTLALAAVASSLLAGPAWSAMTKTYQVTGPVLEVLNQDRQARAGR